MKRIAQLLIAITLVGSASAQTSFLQKIKDKFVPASSQNTAKPNPGQQPVKAVTPAPSKSASTSAAPASKPAASKPVAASVPGANATKAPASAAAKPSMASTAKPAGTTSGKSATAAKALVASTKPAKAEPTKISVAPITPQPKQGAQKAGPFARPKKAKAVKAAAQPVSKPATQSAEATPAPPENKEKKMITAEGRRDPFLSPVVNSAMGPACSTGKRCLEIGQIVVRGVVKSDTGMIAVVVNALNKAYFLKENDPVFNGYVMKITGDSVVFKETYQDKLGKELTREIVKKLTTPAV